MKAKWRKILCWLFGHEWNEYSKRSSYKKKYCNRCRIEVEK